MSIKDFIEEAIEGGWKSNTFKELKFIQFWGNEIVLNYTGEDGNRHEWKYNYSAILLDPEAWKAVGKTERWGGTDRNEQGGLSRSWFIKMKKMIDALAEGKTIEQYLETL